VQALNSHYFRKNQFLDPMKFAIIKERKSPPDRRVVLSPSACQNVLHNFDKASIVIESSDIRAFTDQDYEQEGLTVQTDISNADVLIGVKEVPIPALIPNKSYFFFSHTIKKQPYNRALLQAILEKNITLYDHETLVDASQQRLIGFGYYAGIVGAYNGIRTLGLKWDCFALPKATALGDRKALDAALEQITLPNVKIVLTGTGRVGQGAKEVLDALQIKQLSVEAYLDSSFDQPVYVQLDVLDYVERKDGSPASKSDFFNNPTNYKSTFDRFTRESDMFIAGHFYGKDAPYFFTRAQAKSTDFKIRVVADISCDIDGPVACTLRPSTIEEPIYGYDPQTESEVDFKTANAVAVMAVDNLPCELPKDASEGFGATFVNRILPSFFNGDKEQILERSRMTNAGQLTPAFYYLKDYVNGKE
jgi:alanine dehydrogenase